MRIGSLPPHRRVWIFDLDNTLHDARVHIFPSMHRQMNDFLRREFDLDEGEANARRYLLWTRYGTTLNGLMRHYGTDPARFLRETHRFPGLADLVVHDNPLRHALALLGGRRIVFSNAPRRYVKDVLRVMGAERMFDAIYGIEDARYRGKPGVHGFHLLMRNHDLDPHCCAFIDDHLDNLRTARRLGMGTVWISRDPRKPAHVDMRLGSVIELPRRVLRGWGARALA